MNPFASEFIPEIQLQQTEQRELAHQYLVKQIEITQIDVNQQNIQLLTLHEQLKNIHSFLESAIKSSNNNGYTQQQIDDIQKDYSNRVGIYQTVFKKFNDLLAELFTLQNKLKQFTSSSTTSSSTSSSTTTKSLFPVIPKSNRTSKLETASGIHSSCTPKTPTSVLPTINESDDENIEWDEWDEDEWNDTASTTNSISTLSVNTLNNIPNQLLRDASHITHISTTHTTLKLNNHLNTNTNKLNTNVVNSNNIEINNNNNNINKSGNNSNSNSNNNFVNNFNYNKYENNINLILDSLIYTSPKVNLSKICISIHKYIHSLRNLSYRLVEILIECIIQHGINNNNISTHGHSIHSNQYALLCNDLLTFLRNNHKISTNKFKSLIWNSCYNNFKSIQFGNDPHKFLNIMIIIAEIYNVNAVSANNIFNDILLNILPGTKQDQDILCENDIEGVTALFKKCGKKLDQNKYNQVYVNKYFNYLNDIKKWKKFKNSNLIQQIQDLRSNNWQE